MEQERLSLRRLPEGGAAPRLRRSRSDLRHRGPRHRAEARDPGEPRLRHQGRLRRDLCRGHLRRSRRPISTPPTSSATASSCSASRVHDRAAASSSACIPTMVPQGFRDRAGHGRHQRGRRSTPTAVATDHAGRPGRRRRWRPPPPWWPTSPTSRAACASPPFGRPTAQLTTQQQGADAAPRGRLLHPPARARPARHRRRRSRRGWPSSEISLESIVQRHRGRARTAATTRKAAARCRSSSSPTRPPRMPCARRLAPIESATR